MAAPILWTTKASSTGFRRPAKHWKDGRLVAVVDDLGRQVHERVPPTGRIGSVREVADIVNTKPMREPRSVEFLRDDGNETHNIIRSAAAAGHGDQGTDNSFARFVLAKGKHYGWIPKHACPCDLIARGERHELQMYAKEVRAAAARGEACKAHEVGPDKPPCKHYLAEREARRAHRHEEHLRQVTVHTKPEERTATALAELVQRMPLPGVAPQPEGEFAPARKTAPPKADK